jgi:hypothetical protein
MKEIMSRGNFYVGRIALDDGDRVANALKRGSNTGPGK